MCFRSSLTVLFVFLGLAWSHPTGTSLLQIEQADKRLNFHLSLNRSDIKSALGLREDSKNTLQQVSAYASERLQIYFNGDLSYLDWDSVVTDTGKTYSFYGHFFTSDSTTLSIAPLFFVELNVVSICHILLFRGDVKLLDAYFTAEEQSNFELFHPVEYYLKETKQQVSWISFIWIGFKHIFPLGLDHILFVIGLFLFSRRWKPLSTQTFVFTLAHSFTLALVLLDIVSISSRIVEPFIALSIIFIAFENLFFKTKMIHRIFVVFFFGLLHGMGFATVLKNLQVDSSLFLKTLMSFNIGLELGQIFIVLMMLALTHFIYRKSYYNRVIIIPLNIFIGILGLYWFIQRLI